MEAIISHWLKVVTYHQPSGAAVDHPGIDEPAVQHAHPRLPTKDAAGIIEVGIVQKHAVFSGVDMPGIGDAAVEGALDAVGGAVNDAAAGDGEDLGVIAQTGCNPVVNRRVDNRRGHGEVSGWLPRV